MGHASTVVMDVAVPNDTGHWNGRVSKRAVGEDVGSEDIGDPVDHWSTWAVTLKLEEWLRQIPGPASEIALQKSAVLETAKTLWRTLKLSGL